MRHRKDQRKKIHPGGSGKVGIVLFFYGFVSLSISGIPEYNIDSSQTEGNVIMSKQFYPAPVGTIRLNDPVFQERIRKNREVTIPANIVKCRETGRIDAFRLEWKEGMPNKPHIFWDSDFAKVVEGLALSLMLDPDPAKEAELNEFVDLIVSAQQPDGYLNTYFTQVEPDKRWKCLWYDHELYCAGHLMEAAVAHFRATGKRNFLDCMCRYADYIATVFGTGENQLHGYPGHQEIELALCKLAEAAGDRKYAELAAYFINERGKTPSWFAKESNGTANLKNLQADLPIREQTEMNGHAVRALYYLAGAVDVAESSGDPELRAACERLWDNVVNRRMYITGGIGSAKNGEAFTSDYDLPNAQAYTESCAAIALTLCANRLLNRSAEARYADVMERAIYNGVFSGLSLSGDRFFYQNPLENGPEKSYFPHERQPWFDCSCCPTNFCRFIPQLGSFAYSVSGDTLLINIPSACDGSATFEHGAMEFSIEGNYPYSGTIRFRVRSASGSCRIGFRIPGWCRNCTMTCNGERISLSPENGYVYPEREWRSGDVAEWNLEMPVRVVYANPRVTADAGKAALMRGPLVYALESVDNAAPLSSIVLKADAPFTLTEVSGLPAGTVAISGEAEILEQDSALYSEVPPRQTPGHFTAIPYALWQNRGVSSVQVWMPYR